MKKPIFILAFSALCLMGLPLNSFAVNSVEILEQNNPDITINVFQSVLHVTGADGLTLHIYNATGVEVKSLKVEGSDRRYQLNLPKGCYIVKVGNFVRRILVK